MSIRRLLRGSPFGPLDIEIMTLAFEEALRLSDLTDRMSEHAETIAQRVIWIFQNGEDDPHIIALRVIVDLDSSRRANVTSQNDASEAAP